MAFRGFGQASDMKTLSHRWRLYGICVCARVCVSACVHFRLNDKYEWSTMYKHCWTCMNMGHLVFASVCGGGGGGGSPEGLVKLTTWPLAISSNTCGSNVCIIMLVSLRLICICMHFKLFPLDCAHKCAHRCTKSRHPISFALSFSLSLAPTCHCPLIHLFSICRMLIYIQLWSCMLWLRWYAHKIWIRFNGFLSDG